MKKLNPRVSYPPHKMDKNYGPHNPATGLRNANATVPFHVIEYARYLHEIEMFTRKEVWYIIHALFGEYDIKSYNTIHQWLNYRTRKES